MPDWDLERAAQDMQDAALDPLAWAGVLDRLAQSVGGVGAVLMSVDHRLPGPPVSPGIANLMKDYYAEGWNRSDIRYRGLPTVLRKGVTVDQDFVTPDEIASHPYYKDLLRRHDCLFFAGIGTLTGASFWNITIQRSIGQGPFEPDEVRRLALLARPLTDAVALSRQFGMSHVSGMVDALQHTRQAALLLDEGARVLAMNQRAECMLGPNLDVAQARLLFRDPRHQAAVDKLIAHALAPLTVEGPISTVAAVADAGGNRMFIRAIALRGWARFTFTQASAMLLVGAPEPQADSTAASLANTFKLTAAEIRLVTVLAEGHSLSKAAERLGIRYQTARVHLRSIFQKTDTNRQGQLVALLTKIRGPN